MGDASTCLRGLTVSLIMAMGGEGAGRGESERAGTRLLNAGHEAADLARSCWGALIYTNLVISAHHLLKQGKKEPWREAGKKNHEKEENKKRTSDRPEDHVSELIGYSHVSGSSG